MSPDWAAQRLRNLSLWRAIMGALVSQENGKVVSLADRFRYPRLGAGQMYEAMAARVKQHGQLALGTAVVALKHRLNRIDRVVVSGPQGRQEVRAGHVVASMPITDLVKYMDPRPPDPVLQAAWQLHYRSLVTVNLLLRRAPNLPDQWVYLQSPQVQAGRLHIGRNFSPAMVPEPQLGAVTLEYFCSTCDDLWRAADSTLVEIAKADLEKTGLIPAHDVLDGMVLRVEKAYPIYHYGYAKHLAVVRDWLSGFVNLHCIGRFGQFRYNNMDHAMLTGLLAVRRLLGEEVDPWAVNAEAEYHEEIVAPGPPPAVPLPALAPVRPEERPCAVN